MIYKHSIKMVGHITLLILLLLGVCIPVSAQLGQPMPGAPVTLQNTPQRDTANKTNTNKWRSEKADIFYKKLFTKRTFYPDTSIPHLHRRLFQQSWEYNLGNLGSPVKNLLFTPEERTGPALGYHVFDVYRFRVDSMIYYNTTRPYSAFTYQLGSRAEQMAEILHTQNISPNWNFSVQYRKIGSQGNYKIQRTNHDLANLTTNYSSKDQHYQLNAALVYNKLQHDENGGILSDSFMNLSSYGDRRTIPVRFQNDIYSNRRSSVTNMQRDFTLLLQHSYTIGKTDTTYNDDSTQYDFKLIPRFRITHRLQMGTEKYQYKDVLPDSLRYIPIFNAGFGSSDSVFTEQKWFYVDNTVSLNGFLGKEERQLLFSAGFGNRVDRFATEFGNGDNQERFMSNYLVGSLQKEALEAGQWFYKAETKLFLTGNAAGNLLLRADIGKDISEKIGNLSAGFEQRINNAPYNFTHYQNNFVNLNRTFNKETITTLYGTVDNPFLKLRAGLRNYLITNYIYLNERLEPDQYSGAINLTQIWLSKIFRSGIWVLDNELVYQQKAGAVPVNVPAFMGRHRAGIETKLFNSALKIATGIDIRWHTPYEPSGYTPFLNRFYYQGNHSITNFPETAVFFNFKIKNFRAYLMGDQLQTIFADNMVSTPGYPAPDAMIRFGFTWVMIN